MNTVQSYNYLSKNLQTSLDLGRKIAESVKTPVLIELVGDLGGGKTTLVKGIARELGITKTVTSPTFNIHRSYQAKNDKILEHFDLYRLDDDEIVLNELSESLENPNAVVCVEWANHFHKHLKSDRLIIECSFINETTREFRFSGSAKLIGEIKK